MAAVGALLATSYFQYSARQNEIKHELMEHRRKTLFQALEVIDNVYSNEPLANGKPSNPHNWNIQLARDADNQMRIYCKYPETVRLFRSAVGLHNPNIEKSPGISLEALDDFRIQVAKELELPAPVGLDRNAIWISGLAGAAPSEEIGSAEADSSTAVQTGK